MKTGLRFSFSTSVVRFKPSKAAAALFPSARAALANQGLLHALKSFLRVNPLFREIDRSNGTGFCGQDPSMDLGSNSSGRMGSSILQNEYRVNDIFEFTNVPRPFMALKQFNRLRHEFNPFSRHGIAIQFQKMIRKAGYLSRPIAKRRNGDSHIQAVE